MGPVVALAARCLALGLALVDDVQPPPADAMGRRETCKLKCPSTGQCDRNATADECQGMSVLLVAKEGEQTAKHAQILTELRGNSHSHLLCARDPTPDQSGQSGRQQRGSPSPLTPGAEVGSAFHQSHIVVSAHSAAILAAVILATGSDRPVVAEVKRSSLC